MEISYLLGGVDLEPVLKLVYATSIAVIIVGFYKHSHSGISYSASFSFTINEKRAMITPGVHGHRNSGRLR